MKYSDEKVEKLIKLVIPQYCPNNVECLQNTTDDDDDKCVLCWQKALAGDDK